MIDLKKVDYNQLNARQKENYNYHKVASALADYGYDCMRLNNDWEGADFIAVKDDQMIKVQLKGRLTFAKKYIGKNIYVAFIEKGVAKIYNHDIALEIATKNILESQSWVSKGEYHFGKTPIHYNKAIQEI